MKTNKILTILIIGVAVLLLIMLIVFLRAARSSESQEPAATAIPTATLLPAPTESGNTNNDAAIQNIVWQWTQLTEQSTGVVTAVPNPGSYTLIFRPDETFTGMADCNSISGTYSTKNGFSINVKTSTSAYCGEASLDKLYLSTLADVAAGGPDGAGGLALETRGGAQRMQFRNGGTAP